MSAQRGTVEYLLDVVRAGVDLVEVVARETVDLPLPPDQTLALREAVSKLRNLLMDKPAGAGCLCCGKKVG